MALVFAMISLGAFQYSPLTALPGSATEVHEYTSETSEFLGDAYYCLKAKVTEPEFENFTKKRGLLPIEAGQDGKFFSNAGDATWWDAESSNDGIYIRFHSSSHLERAKYQNGYLYYIDSVGY